MKRIRAIVGIELRMAVRDPFVLVVYYVMPILVMAFFKPLAGVALRNEGFHSASGAEQVVPGMYMMFGFLAMGQVGFALFREHGWRTWDRLRTSEASPSEIMIGKITVPLLISLSQFAVIFLAGSLLLGLRVHGSMAALFLQALVVGLSLVSLGLAVAAVCRSTSQINVISNVGQVVLGSLGGAFIPLSLLPLWLQHVAPATPTYWGMRGFTQLTLHDGGIASVMPSVGVLLAFSAGFALVAMRSFRFDQRKISWE